MRVTADDHVVEKWEPNQPGSARDLDRHTGVVDRWRRVSARVVVHQHERSCAKAQRDLQQISRGRCAADVSALCRATYADQPMASIERDEPDLFVGQPA